MSKRFLQFSLLFGVLAILGYLNRGSVVTALVDTYGLSDPFIGLTTNGTIQPGLFSIQASGVSTDPVRLAARNFLSTLKPDQQSELSFAVDDDEWRQWMNIHLYNRQGVGFIDMSPDQKEAGYELLQAGLSPRGYKQARDIMKLDTTLGELRGDDFDWYGEERFWLTLMGSPDAVEPWGWQLDGHHLVINYFVLGDQVVMSPVFLGAEPVIAPSGKHAGTAVLQQEQNRGLAMINALTQTQRNQAVLNPDKTANNAQAEFYSDNVVVPYAGLKVSALNPLQRDQLVGLIDLFVGHLDDGHAQIKMQEVVRHLDDTYFAWVGGRDSDSVFYYRIHSPVLYIEFDHQGPIGLRDTADTTGPQRNHIHAVMRTPNGNDYGKDLLRQHLEKSPH